MNAKHKVLLESVSRAIGRFEKKWFELQCFEDVERVLTPELVVDCLVVLRFSLDLTRRVEWDNKMAPNGKSVVETLKTINAQLNQWKTWSLGKRLDSTVELIILEDAFYREIFPYLLWAKRKIRSYAEGWCN